MKRTAFVKKRNKKNIVPGTHTSVHNGLLLVSTGIPTLDDVLGGGLPVGSVLMVEEDKHTRFSSLLTKYFLAEGVMCQHGIFLASANQKPCEILKSLPKPVSSASCKTKQSNSDEMKIAFMYNNMPQHTTALSDVSKFGHYYDISAVMDASLLEKCETTLLEINMTTKENLFNFILRKLQKLGLRLMRNLTEVALKPQTLSSPDFLTMTYSVDILKGNFEISYTLRSLKVYIDNNLQYKPPASMTPDTFVNVLRLSIPNFASPLWCNCEDENIQEITRFLHCLRAMARQSILVCMITVPTHLFTPTQVAVFRQFVDCSVGLNAFVGEKNPAFKQYHGMFEIHKLPCVNSMTPVVPESFDLAFELKRTKFVIECFHLPPDMSETVSRQGMDETAKKSTLCGGATLNTKLDF